MVEQLKFKDKLPLKSRKQWIIGLSILGLVVTGASVIYTLNSTEKTSQKPVVVETIKDVSALGRIEPQGEVIKLAPPPVMGGAKVIELLVKEGDIVKANQVIAVLDTNQSQKAVVERAQKDVKVAEANLAVVKAGAKIGEINAQKATIERLKAELTSELTSNQAKIARLEVQLKGETVAQKATIDRLQAELNNAESEYKRYDQLAQNGAISASELDSRRTTLDTGKESVKEAQANYSKTLDSLAQEINETKALAKQREDGFTKQIKEAEANLDRIAEVRPVDVQQAQAELDRAQASLKQYREDLDLTYIKAPSQSRVLKINTYPGESADSTNGIVELGETNQMMVVAEVYESDINKVSVGQEAVITSESGTFTGELKGKVSEIGWQIGKKDVLDTDPAADVDSRVVEVKILLNREDSKAIAKLTYSKVLVKIAL